MIACVRFCFARIRRGRVIHDVVHHPVVIAGRAFHVAFPFGGVVNVAVLLMDVVDRVRIIVVMFDHRMTEWMMFCHKSS